MTRLSTPYVLTFVLLVSLLFPLFARAFPFGGAIGTIKPCYNNAIYVNLGPPRGGAFIWTPSSRTYQFGPPRRSGQWLLGLASAPYYCVVSIFPVIVWPGTHIDMMGSSGAAAPSVPQQQQGSGYKYPQFTSAEAYDAEVRRLRGCGASGASPTQECSDALTRADDIEAERIKRFGPINLNIDLDEYCRTRTTPPANAENDPCAGR